MITEHLALINKIKSLTDLKTEETENDYEYSFSISSKESIYWINIYKEDKSIIVGIDLVHEHFDDKINPVSMGLSYFKDILTHDIAITHYFRGERNYKNQYYFLKNNEKEFIGSAAMQCLYFWKKKYKTESIIKKVITSSL